MPLDGPDAYHQLRGDRVLRPAQRDQAQDLALPAIRKPTFSRSSLSRTGSRIWKYSWRVSLRKSPNPSASPGPAALRPCSQDRPRAPTRSRARGAIVNPVLIAEDLLLLLTDDRTGKLAVSSTHAD